MARRGACGLGLVVLMWAGAQGAEARSERSQRGGESWRQGRQASPGELEFVTSAESAQAGERLFVEVSAGESMVVRAEVFRLGFYEGTGALRMWSGGPYNASMLPPCPGAAVEPNGACPERWTFSFEIGGDWTPGLYLVKVTRADGLKRVASVVVKESHPVGAPAPRRVERGSRQAPR